MFVPESLLRMMERPAAGGGWGRLALPLTPCLPPAS